ncbi:esterase-like activity of phytase family protein [Maribacter sp. 1_MG-2023]|uniref:esterase-like activity of phytase family protein n=1 Tax=Maribacter sp. 1_MG-2023 TaxID=3062677 RepID=UPI0026E150B1|nr:esterase-like activity of phytase family protein [Maribacter sp. 1_MG-2023]MDO6472836.1 esterase-like activity of phytase family protein [Maribacter sp. 1_MG-2023]
MSKLARNLLVFTVLLVISCGTKNDTTKIETSLKLRFVDEYILSDETTFENTRVGGLSGIDYANGTWYAISDDNDSPRFYKAIVSYDLKGFNTIQVTAVTHFKDENGNNLSKGMVDPESIRYDNSAFIWTSEGNIKDGLKPFVQVADSNGIFVKEFILAERYLPNTDENFGPHHNGVFEGITLSYDKKGYWVAMELPLKEDGVEPTLEDTDSPVRIAFINRETGHFEKEIVYELDKVSRPAINGSAFELNGIVEILEYNKNKFFVLERSYSMGYADGGNTVKIYDVDASKATDVSSINSLKGASYTQVTKSLLFNFEDIRKDLTNGIVDNIEGITFGPNFENGNQSLVVVADNNFSLYGPQLNQFILFEVEK